MQLLKTETCYLLRLFHKHYPVLQKHFLEHGIRTGADDAKVHKNGERERERERVSGAIAV